MEQASQWWFGDQGASMHALDIHADYALRGQGEALDFIVAWTTFMHAPTANQLDAAQVAFTAWKKRAMI